MTVKYTLKDFYVINEKGFDVILTDDIVSQINNIVKQVGSPNYIRTPIFHKAPKHSQSSAKKKRDLKPTAESQQLWDSMTKHPVPTNSDSDQPTVSLQTIRSYLNKLTDKNVEEISEKIITIIDKVVEKNDSEMIDSIANAIFDIASSNRFFSAVYAELYSLLITKYENIQSILESNYSSFLDKFEEIQYVSPDVDYDAFCRINKENDKRRAMSAFYLNLYCIGVLPIEKIEFLLTHIMNKLLETIHIEDKCAEISEYTENIAVFYNSDMEYNKGIRLSNGLSIHESILFLAKTKNKTYPSLTSKCIFKFMGLCNM